ncbi:MFS transporter [Lysinibacillus sp. NPDC048646]|uniref:MFS transporter n=1 Tax=Lysinibacillus sp. NPDC048646 TaxID=3390574 RepID=UPI003D02021F
MNHFAIYLLALGAFVTGTAEFVVSGILEIISSDLDISVSVAGQLITIYSLFYAIGALILVMITSKFDRKKVLFYSMVIFLTGNIMAYISHNYTILMFSRVVLALSGGLYIVVATNYAAHLAQPGKRGSAMATVITGFTVSLAFGVPIGTFTAAYIDWRNIFLIIGVVTCINILLLQKFIPKLDGNKPMPIKQQLILIKDKRLLIGLFITAFWILGYTLVFAYISPILSLYAGFSIEMISMTLLILGVSAFIGSRFGGYAVDKWGSYRTITISLVIHTIVLMVLTFTIHSTIGTLITIMIWAVAAWTTTPANQFYLTSLKPQSSEIILSFNTAIMNIGMTLGAGLGGLVIEYTDIIYLIWLGGLMVFIALGIACYFFILGKKQPRTKII